MEHHKQKQSLTWGYLLVSLLLVLASCQSTPAIQEEPSAPIKEESKGQYLQIVSQARNMEENYAALQQQAASFLQANATSEEQKSIPRMTVALVGAGAYFWDEQQVQGQELAEKAYQYAGQKGIFFLDAWEKKEIVKKSLDLTKKYAQMKDLIIASSNGGLEHFKQGSAAFQKAKFAEAIEHYKKALAHGLIEDEIRLIAYSRLAASLFREQRLSEAREQFFQAWLVFPQKLGEKLHAQEINFGSKATVDYLQKLLADFERAS